MGAPISPGFQDLSAPQRTQGYPLLTLPGLLVLGGLSLSLKEHSSHLIQAAGLTYSTRLTPNED